MWTRSDGYLVPCAYCIALLDFVSALLFAIISGIVFAKHGNWSALVALIFTSFWLIIIIVLVAGIFRRRIGLVRIWLVFTCLGIILDGFILLYGLTLAIAVNWDGVKITVLPFVGLAVEMTFVYVIYLFYPYLEEFKSKDPPPPRESDRSRSTAGFIVEVEDEVEEEKEKEPLSRKELKLLEKKAKERMKEDKAKIKELKKQMRKKT